MHFKYAWAYPSVIKAINLKEYVTPFIVTPLLVRPLTSCTKSLRMSFTLLGLASP